MSVIFVKKNPNERFLHQKIEFFPGVVLGFEDPDADQYFINAGWAVASKDAPVRVYSQDEVSIDPTTVIAETGKLVIGDLTNG